MKKSAILLTTHNRNSFVKRFLEFYKKQNHTGDIIIAHSGHEISEINIQNLVKQYHPLNLKLFTFNEKTKFFSKIISVLEKVDHEYIAICADDDYLLPAGFDEAVDFLSTHPDYISVAGYVFTIGTLSDRQQYCYPYPQLPIKLSNNLKRLSSHFRFYTATFYNTYRKNDLLFIYQQAAKLFAEKSFNYRYMELFMAATATLMGKIHILNALYMIRQGDNPIAAGCSLAPESLILFGSETSQLFHRHFVTHLSRAFKIRSPYKKIMLSNALAKYFGSFSHFRTFLQQLYQHKIEKPFSLIFFKSCFFYLFKNRSTSPSFYQEKTLEKLKKTAEFSVISHLIYNFPLGMEPVYSIIAHPDNKVTQHDN